MIKKLLCAFAVLWFGMGLAFGQANITIGSPPFTGTSIGNGVTASSTLFATGSAPLSLNYPFSSLIWVKGNTLGNGLNLFSTGTYGTNEYIIAALTPGSDNNDSYSFQELIGPAGQVSNFCQTGASLFAAGRMCMDVGYINDGNWHAICSVHPAAGALSTIQVDGIVRSQKNMGTQTTTSGHWAFMSGPAVGTVAGREIALWNRTLTPAECAAIANRGFAGYSLLSGNAPASLSAGLVGYWPMSTAAPGTGSGATFSCPDLSGNSNPLTLGQAPPTCTISTPTAGVTAGTVSLTGTASDAIGIAGVAWSLTNGTNTLTLSNSLSTAPYTQSFDTTKLVDSTYTLQMTCTNVGGATSTATRSLIFSNSVTAKNYFFSPTGSDSNNCTASGTPCQTATKFASLIFHGGDTIAFDAGNGALSTTAPFALCTSTGKYDQTPPNNVNAPGFTGCTINYYPGVLTTTITNYNAGGTCNAIVGPAHCAQITQVNSGTANGITNLVQSLNASNLTIQNLALTGDPSMLTTIGSVGITMGISGALPLATQGNLVQNNYIIGFQTGISAPNTSSGAQGGEILNNQITMSASSGAAANAYYGIFVNNDQNYYNVVGNLLSNIGAIVASVGAPNGNGVAIEIGNSIYAPALHPTIVEFNVIYNGGFNGNSCGGPDAIETYYVGPVIIQNNEVYNQGTSSTYGCDDGGIDADLYSVGVVIQNNYTHGNWGYGIQSYSAGITGASAHTVTQRFNVSENDGRGSANGGGPGLGAASGGLEWIYNNTIYADQTGLYPGLPPAFNGSVIYGAGWGVFGVCPIAGSIFANNIISVSQDFTGIASVFYGSGTQGCVLHNNFFKNNLWYANTGGQGVIMWHSVGYIGDNYTSLAAWVAASNETGAINADPKLVGPASGGTCWPGGSTPPAGPQNAPSAGCPAGYVLQAGSPALNAAFTGLTSAPYNQTITEDYYNNACSGGNVHHIGASACQ